MAAPFDWNTVFFPACGFGGALLGSAVQGGRLQLPRLVIERKTRTETLRYLDPGFLTGPFVGALLAAWIDGTWQMATFSGLVAGYVGPQLVVSHVIAPALKRHTNIDLSDYLPDPDPSKDASHETLPPAP